MMKDPIGPNSRAVQESPRLSLHQFEREDGSPSFSVETSIVSGGEVALKICEGPKTMDLLKLPDVPSPLRVIVSPENIVAHFAVTRPEEIIIANIPEIHGIFAFAIALHELGHTPQHDDPNIRPLNPVTPGPRTFAEERKVIDTLFETDRILSPEQKDSFEKEENNFLEKRDEHRRTIDQLEILYEASENTIQQQCFEIIKKKFGTERAQNIAQDILLESRGHRWDPDNTHTVQFVQYLEIVKRILQEEGFVQTEIDAIVQMPLDIHEQFSAAQVAEQEAKNITKLFYKKLKEESGKLGAPFVHYQAISVRVMERNANAHAFTWLREMNRQGFHVLDPQRITGQDRIFLESFLDLFQDQVRREPKKKLELSDVIKKIKKFIITGRIDVLSALRMSNAIYGASSKNMSDKYPRGAGGFKRKV